jgi:hypothetical protein
MVDRQKLPPGDRFFISFLLMIIIARVFIFFTHMSTPDIGSFETHHYMTGIVLLLAGLLTCNLVLCGMGTGLILDEWMIFFVGPQDWKQYFSAIYLFGIVGLAVLVFLLRHRLAKAVERTHKKRDRS